MADQSKTKHNAHADGWAIGLSGLCLVHCLALPVVALAAPAALGLERYHLEVHVAFLVVALALGGSNDGIDPTQGDTGR